LRFHGAQPIARVDFAAAMTKSGANLPDHVISSTFFRFDLEANMEATRALLRACFLAQPGADDVEIMLAYPWPAPPRRGL
jgi:hypothetical protein